MKEKRLEMAPVVEVELSGDVIVARREGVEVSRGTVVSARLGSSRFERGMLRADVVLTLVPLSVDAAGASETQKSELKLWLPRAPKGRREEWLKVIGRVVGAGVPRTAGDFGEKKCP